MRAFGLAVLYMAISLSMNISISMNVALFQMVMHFIVNTSSHTFSFLYVVFPGSAYCGVCPEWITAVLPVFASCWQGRQLHTFVLPI